jgi:hypothetical protein
MEVQRVREAVKRNRPKNGAARKIAAGAAAALFAWGLISSLRDLKRYIRMTMM